MKNTEKVHFFLKKKLVILDIEARPITHAISVMQVIWKTSSSPFSSGMKIENDTTFSLRCSNKFNDPLILTEMFCLGLFCLDRCVIPKLRIIEFCFRGNC